MSERADLNGEKHDTAPNLTSDEVASEFTLNGLLCVICKTPIGDEGMSQFAAYGGLPSPCCHICFEVNDYSIKNLEDLKIKSLLRRETGLEFVKRINGHITL